VRRRDPRFGLPQAHPRQARQHFVAEIRQLVRIVHQRNRDPTYSGRNYWKAAATLPCELNVTAQYMHDFNTIRSKASYCLKPTKLET